MSDSYAYLSVKLYLKEGQTEETIQEIVQELDYSFDHEQITDYEIVDIADTQICSEPSASSNFHDLYDMSYYLDEEGGCDDS